MLCAWSTAWELKVRQLARSAGLEAMQACRRRHARAPRLCKTRQRPCGCKVMHSNPAQGQAGAALPQHPQPNAWRAGKIPAAHLSCPTAAPKKRQQGHHGTERLETHLAQLGGAPHPCAVLSQGAVQIGAGWKLRAAASARGSRRLLTLSPEGLQAGQIIQVFTRPSHTAVQAQALLMCILGAMWILGGVS